MDELNNVTLAQITEIFLNNFQPNTLFIGQEAYFLDQTTSTNDWMWQFIKSRTPAEGAMVFANYQAQGKGRIARVWNSNKGENILCSFFLKPAFITIQQHASLNFSIALAVADTFSAFLNDPIALKWPNDIICDNKKLAGILIENTIKGDKIENVVVGIGMNINQKHFEQEPLAASVFMLKGQFTPLEVVLSKLAQNLEKQYLRLRTANHQTILDEYNRRLYGKNTSVTIKTDNNLSEGILKEVKANGEIEIVTSEGLMRYQYNNVKLYYNGFNS